MVEHRTFEKLTHRDGRDVIFVTKLSQHAMYTYGWQQDPMLPNRLNFTGEDLTKINPSDHDKIVSALFAEGSIEVTNDLNRLVAEPRPILALPAVKEIQ